MVQSVVPEPSSPRPCEKLDRSQCVRKPFILPRIEQHRTLVGMTFSASVTVCMGNYENVCF